MTLAPDLLSALQSAARRNLLRGRKKNIDRSASSKPVLLLLKKAAVAIVWLHCFFFGWVALLCVMYKFVDPPVTGFMVYRRVVDDTTIKPIIPIAHKNISQGTVQAFVRLEDHTFFEHWGISPGAIREAFDRNEKIGRMVFGGSTISQQLARNLFLNPERTYFRKYLEAGSTILLELIVGKSRMMDLYLNVIEFGPGIFGVGQGARYHYKANFTSLSYEQRARMAVIITDPLHYNVQDFAKNRGMWARYKALVGD